MNLLQIDVTKEEYEAKEDLVHIRFQNNDVIQINFTKFFVQSNYFLDKYKYSEALNSIQEEIDAISNKLNISDESIKYFLEFVETNKVNIPIDHYKALYILSEYFSIPKFTSELNNINQKKLFNDLNFSIQMLLDSKTVNNDFETKFTSKIENFLAERINECIKNEKFSKLPVPTVFRMIERSKEKVDFNLLTEFICGSIKTRFILLKCVEFHKLSDDKFEQLINLIEKQDEHSRNMYFEYIPFNLSMFRNMKNQYNQLLKEMNRTKEELNQTKVEMSQTKEELNQTKVEMSRTKEALEQSKKKQEQTNEELNQTKQKYEEELFKCKKEINEVKNKLSKEKMTTKRYTQSIIVSGVDDDNQLGQKPNNRDVSYNLPIIDPPMKLSFDPSSLLSYSTYRFCSVLVTNDGLLKGVGDNKDGKISSTLKKTVIDNFTDFSIKDANGHHLTAVSAVCCTYSTLYIFSKSSGKGRHLVFYDCQINKGDPVFLDIGNHQPVALFGGYSHSAAIGSEGEVIFINRNSVANSPNSPIAAVSLPDGEKASSVACCDDSVFVLSSNGRVFSSPVESNSSLNFSQVSELSGEEIVWVSGTCNHCLAVSKEGKVFVRGRNGFGQLGLGNETESVSTFTNINSLVGYKIRAAYAGWGHSLFQTQEGKILSCGRNDFGELLLNNQSSDNVYLPTETTITSGASFCIAGLNLSAVFIGSGPPPNTPNIRVVVE